ncbi:hypothetical protein O7632_28220 [Solwaraspora sp. WMMD406]|uniref:hypothetical protein n=1 Tax=Solwaraspora sp. WMMD406 TaxID=3016095 RepID=UPI002415EE54|nr:hypothetical protein [Solwaraspora sp. WMMD406]MDG4767950.1 hypothetical protein [Solwaraspora sp. WMMD406]
MSGFGGRWLLRDHDGVLLAELVVTDGDFPWLYATLHQTEAFEPVRPLFEQELRAMRASEDGEAAGDAAGAVDAWERAYLELRAATVLIDPDGRPVSEFLLHVDGDEAWWRWIDESSNDDEDDDASPADDA